MKPILVDCSCALVAVYYPSRVSPDVYVATGKPFVHCLQCGGADGERVALTDLVDHIRGHDRRVGPVRILASAGDRDDAGNRIVYEVKTFSDKPPDDTPHDKGDEVA